MLQHKQLFFYDGQNEIGSSDQELRILGHTDMAEIASAVAIELGGKRYTPIYDLQGTICGLATDTLVDNTPFTPFGEPLASTQLKNPWGFCSKRHDYDIGLVFFGRRYYDPETGRFFTPDPSGFTDGLNLYAYCLNNPITQHDLYGLRIHVEFHYNLQNAPRDLTRGINFTGAAIETFSQHVIPIPHLRDLGVFIGRALQGTLRKPLRENSSHTSIGKKDLQNSSVFYVNGILTEKEDNEHTAKYLSYRLGDAKVESFHSSTRGFISDVISAFFAKLGIPTRDSFQLADKIRERITYNHNIGNEGKIHVFAHSRGGAYLANALRLLSHEERSMLNVYTFGSANLFDISGVNSTEHYVSSRDFVPMTHPFNYIKAKMGRSPNVTFLPSQGGIGDHSLLGPTYGRRLQRIIDEIIKPPG